MPRIMKRKSVMTAKRKYVRKARMKPKRRFAGKAGIARVVNKMLKRKIETKQSTFTITDGQQIFHNNFLTLDGASNFFATNQGTGDPMNTGGQRVGDEITVKGIMFKMMIELNERYSDVTCRCICVRAAKGDTPTRDTLFAGVSGNKMLDNFNNERYSIIFQKTFKITARNQGTGAANVVYADGGSSGLNTADSSSQLLSRATRIVKFYVPGTKFFKNGVCKYENGSSTQVKFFDYHLLLYAYSNYSTNQDVFYVVRVNDYIKTTYYTDA